ncbi:MAG: hypothetical protein ACFFEF_19750, partial [Candidatus Thorarchaeota archaeon]
CIGDGAGALSWAKAALDRDEAPHYSLIEIARALILLGKLREAAKYLDLAEEGALKDGREWVIAGVKYVNGLLELAEGRTLDGIESLEEALEIFDRIKMDIHAVPCLIALARAEVEKYDISGDLDTSGPWMTKLEQRARERDYPGILMEHALLKAEFQIKQGASEAARKTLTDALDIYDSPSIRTLRKRIEERFQSLMSDA